MNSIDLFSSQLRGVLLKYPNFSIKNKNGLDYIKGIIDVPNDENEIVRSFLIEIHWKDGFPNRFPKLLEVGGDIPNYAEWHKYPNSACCITVEADEILKCKYNITLLRFIDEYAIPYLANQVHKMEYGYYKNGEYDHFGRGIIQFYTMLFKTSDYNKWLDYYNITFENKKNNTNRNEPCLCGGNQKYKNCHLKVFEMLASIGKKQVLKDFSIILK